MPRPAIVLCVLLVACAADKIDPGPPAPSYVYVWAGSADSTRPKSFLAVVDIRAGSPTKGKVVRVVPAGAGKSPHHTEHQLESDGELFANDFTEGTTYRFDLSKPGDPKLLGSFTTAGPYAYPHSFVRLANGDRLATYQKKIDGTEPGGLVELRPDGTALRWASAAPADGDSTTLVPYSLDVLANMDRVVSTSTSMTEIVGVNVQVWRLSDLKVLQTLTIPAADEHAGHMGEMATMDTADHLAGHHLLPGEPRTLADGKTVMFGTFTCGLYAVTDIATAPTISFVYSYPGKWCAVPVVVNNFWVWTIPQSHAVVVLDVSDPLRPKEVSRYNFGEMVEPHWMARDASGTRLLVNSGGHGGDTNLFLLRIDPKTGALSRDSDLPAVSLARIDVPGVGVVPAKPHGAVFGM